MQSPRGASGLESPFARRHIQLTLAVLATAAMFWLLVTWWQSPQQRDWVGDENRLQIVIDLNRAEARELALLPGVGPVLAKRIVENRDRLGPFHSVQELQRVRGIGPKTLEVIQSCCVAYP